MPIDFKQKENFIKRLINEAEYTTAARECLVFIDCNLHGLLIKARDELPNDSKERQKILEEEAKLPKGSKAKRIEESTLGQCVGLIRDTKFFTFYKNERGESFKDLTNLNELNKLRNQLFHPDSWVKMREASKYETEQLFGFLKNLAETFGLNGQNPRLSKLKEQFSAKKSVLDPEDPDLSKEVLNYIKDLEMKAIDDTAEKWVEIIEKFSAGQSTTEEFSKSWKTLYEFRRASYEKPEMDFSEWREQLQQGEIVLFLGSIVPDQLILPLKQDYDYQGDSESFPEICEYAQLKSSRLGLCRKIKMRVEGLPPVEDDTFKKLYEWLATVEKSLIIISTDCNTQLQEVFKVKHKKFVLFSPALENAHLGKFILEYSDKEKPELYTSEKITGLELLEDGYSLIFKIRGCFSLSENKHVPAKDCLVLTERDYFKFARYPDKLVPDYLIRCLNDRSLWFLGHRPQNWQNRLLTQIILSNHRSSATYYVDNETAPLPDEYWSFHGVKNCRMNVNTFIKRLLEEKPA